MWMMRKRATADEEEATEGTLLLPRHEMASTPKESPDDVMTKHQEKPKWTRLHVGVSALLMLTAVQSRLLMARHSRDGKTGTSVGTRAAPQSSFHTTTSSSSAAVASTTTTTKDSSMQLEDMKIDQWMDDWEKALESGGFILPAAAASDAAKSVENTSATTFQNALQWASKEGQDLESRAGQEWKTAKNWTGQETNQAEQWASDEVQSVQNMSGQALHNAETWAQNAWGTSTNKTEHWFQRAWKSTIDEAHTVWEGVTNVFNHSKDAVEHSNENATRWWNKTVQTEDEWWNHTLGQLRTLGLQVKSMWNASVEEAEEEEHELGQKEHQLEHQFNLWWKNASQEERLWWNHTKEASIRFEHAAENNTHFWWDATRHTVEEDWQAASHTENAWWNATERWFQDLSELPGGAALVYLNTSKAYPLLMNGYAEWFDYSGDFFQYQSAWDAQINQAFCAVASSAALLNSLRHEIALPIDPLYDPYPYATQRGILSSECANQNVIYYNKSFSGLMHMPYGLSMLQAQALLRCYLDTTQWNVTVHPVDPQTTSIQTMRQDLRSALSKPNARVIINYHRGGLGQVGGGHFSPLASYSPEEDAFLIMDVAKYKYPPVWVKASQLWMALGTADLCGSWDFPDGQKNLTAETLTPPYTDEEYQLARDQLGCKATFRGYIIVESKSVSER